MNLAVELSITANRVGTNYRKVRVCVKLQTYESFVQNPYHRSFDKPKTDTPLLWCVCETWKLQIARQWCVHPASKKLTRIQQLYSRRWSLVAYQNVKLSMNKNLIFNLYCGMRSESRCGKTVSIHLYKFYIL